MQILFPTVVRVEKNSKKTASDGVKRTKQKKLPRVV